MPDDIEKRGQQRDAGAQAIKFAEIAMGVTEAGTRYLVDDYAGAVGALGRTMFRVATAYRTSSRQAERLKSLEDKVDAHRQQANQALDELESRVERVYESLAWLQGNYLTTADEGRVRYLRNAIAHVVTGSDDERWVGLLSRIVTDIAPIEAHVLMEAIPLQGESSTQGFASQFSEYVFEDRMVEATGFETELIRSTVSSLEGRGLTKLWASNATDWLPLGGPGSTELVFQFQLTQLGKRVAEMLRG